jgi:hypothetical protein
MAAAVALNVSNGNVVWTTLRTGGKPICKSPGNRIGRKKILVTVTTGRILG